MKVRNIALDDDSMPETVTVEMTVDEAALIVAMMAPVAPRDVTNACGDIRWGNTLNDVHDGLMGGLFNRFWDSGPFTVVPRLDVTIEEVK